MAAELTKTLEGKMVLGVVATAGIPAQPEGPALACRIRLTGDRGVRAGHRQRRDRDELGRLSASSRSRSS